MGYINCALHNKIKGSLLKCPKNLSQQLKYSNFFKITCLSLYVTLFIQMHLLTLFSSPLFRISLYYFLFFFLFFLFFIFLFIFLCFLIFFLFPHFFFFHIYSFLLFLYFYFLSLFSLLFFIFILFSFLSFLFLIFLFSSYLKIFIFFLFFSSLYINETSVNIYFFMCKNFLMGSLLKCPKNLSQQLKIS